MESHLNNNIVPDYREISHEHSDMLVKSSVPIKINQHRLSEIFQAKCGAKNRKVRQIIGSKALLIERCKICPDHSASFLITGKELIDSLVQPC